ncbi:MAG: peptidyl-prolyl cis-trans isomerase [Elusimicrobia bacterium]|nr:peptidyl-prolyl cis-trans isomerase [Elusimicrobiota bacterium]
MKKILFSFLTVTILSTFATFAFAKDEQIAATVNGEKIYKEEVSKRMWQNHFENTINNIVDETLLLQEGKKLKIKVSKKETDNRLKEIKSAYKDDKEFETTFGNEKDDLTEKIKNELLIKKTVIESKKIEFTDEAVKKFFEENKKNFDKPESTRLRQIFVSSEKEINDVHLALEAGADFAKLSSLKSINENLKKNDGDLGYVSKNMLVKDIAEAISSLKQGQYTKPLKINGGYTILKVEDTKKAEPADFDKIKDDLKKSLINQAVMQNLPILLSELKQTAKIEIMR